MIRDVKKMHQDKIGNNSGLPLNMEVRDMGSVWSATNVVTPQGTHFFRVGIKDDPKISYLGDSMDGDALTKMYLINYSVPSY